MRQNGLAEIVEALIDTTADRISTKVIAGLRLNPVPEQQLYTIPQAAHLVGRTPKAIRELVVRGAIEKSPIDGRVQIHIDELRRWMREGSRK